MSGFLRIKNKYNLKNLFDFVPLDKVVEIIKYRKSLIDLLELTKEEIIIFSLMSKLVK